MRCVVVLCATRKLKHREGPHSCSLFRVPWAHLSGPTAAVSICLLAGGVCASGRFVHGLTMPEGCLAKKLRIWQDVSVTQEPQESAGSELTVDSWLSRLRRASPGTQSPILQPPVPSWTEISHPSRAKPSFTPTPLYRLICKAYLSLLTLSLTL